ncbi:MAG: methylmalonyl Co-A mutase-associated GTPase MeaB [Flavobacteriaceae bacterium]|jgi:LAO/AO transport system kinase|nr:methylmalonyl Co-A mutase-associated GTPase MeaB [Flavobacteriaceae bacterium]MBT6705929.1 methylmalonyl Co-A mutase-associated GTPase MeaB [Flavobacteriaceae bacterium]|tara:strand:- start:1021 stop:2100 length:1080 start_codon:yes stop_codon:yes gene_type:complete
MNKKEANKSALNEKKGVAQPKSISVKVASTLKTKRIKIPATKELIKGILKKDKTALSRSITLVESTVQKHQDQAREIIETCLTHANNSIRIGITGVPGVGKSTFIEQFGTLLAQKNYKVAVLAVDPSSSISGGSILGDKTRMEDLVREPNAFIRPSASRNSLGGVARNTREAIILCEAAGYNIILIETVGVGQSETVVHSMTDFFLLLKLAGAGDELQGIKRGIIEMADSIVINKADGNNITAAQLAKTEFNRALHLYPDKGNDWTPKTLTCSALHNEGVSEIWELIQKYNSITKENGYFQQKRNDQNRYWLLQTIESTLKSDFYNHQKIKEELKKQLILISENKTSPFEAANYLLTIR